MEMRSTSEGQALEADVPVPMQDVAKLAIWRLRLKSDTPKPNDNLRNPLEPAFGRLVACL